MGETWQHSCARPKEYYEETGIAILPGKVMIDTLIFPSGL
jgi:hypothetical protein